MQGSWMRMQKGELMSYFPLLVDEAGAMITDVIHKFVDQEIMPIRDKLDDDVDHVLINQLLIKMSALGVFNVELPGEGAETAGPSFPNACAVIEEFSRGDAGIGLVAGISSWAMAGALYGRNQEVVDLYHRMQQEKQPTFACFAMTEPESGGGGGTYATMDYQYRSAGFPDSKHLGRLNFSYGDGRVKPGAPELNYTFGGLSASQLEELSRRWVPCYDQHY